MNKGLSARQRKINTSDAAMQHISENPAIYLTPFVGTERGNKNDRLPSEVETAVLDLHTKFPDLNARQIGELVGVSREAANKIIEHEDSTEFSAADNKAAGEAHLAALRTNHPRRRYEDDSRAVSEFTGQVIPFRARSIPTYIP